MMPVLFVSHGAPTLPLDKAAPAHKFFLDLASLTPPPRAIVVISAHYEAPAFTVTAAPELATIYDFSGFPDELYRLRYQPPGDPALARHIHSLIQGAGLPAALDESRGIDHGAWTPLILAWPKADIPVLQVSLRKDLDPAQHIALGRALTALRQDGVLLMGSGGAVHNLRELDWHDGPGGPSPWASEFASWLDETMLEHRGDARTQRLARWTDAPFARMAHPREEHLIPLHVVSGAAENEPAARLFNGWQMRDLSLAAYGFGLAKA